MKVLGFCGLPGSGKSTIIEVIVDLGKVITMGDVIRNEAKKRNVPLIDENLGKIAKELREIGGPNIVAEKCVEWIKTLKSKLIFIDGLRSIEEVNIFKKYWKFPVIAIVVDDDLRFKRLTERGRSDDPKNIKQLKERDSREIGFGLKEVIANSNYQFKNDLPVIESKKKARTLFLQIIDDY